MNFKDFDFCNNAQTRVDRWATQAEIEQSVTNVVPWYFLRSVATTDYYNPPTFTVTVKLYPWAWLWFGRKHEEYNDLLQDLCDTHRPVAVVGTVNVK